MSFETEQSKIILNTSYNRRLELAVVELTSLFYTAELMSDDSSS